MYVHSGAPLEHHSRLPDVCRALNEHPAEPDRRLPERDPDKQVFARAFARPAPAPTTQEGAHAIDTLELQVQRIYTDDEGDMAVVQADVLLPVRGKVTAMSLVALLTRTDAAGDWRWVALQFSPRSPGS